MKHKIFIDGASGTTGLEIRERLSEREDIEILALPESERKELSARIDAASSADLSILCLPDEASKELCEKLPESARVIDTSTAHRTSEGWVYGMPELTRSARDEIRGANRVANPGCHASGFILLVKPLIDQGLLALDAELSCTSLTGYSGGGKKMIADYEKAHEKGVSPAPSEYALSQEHKHLAEMKRWTGLEIAPVFIPVVCDFYRGMLVSVGIMKEMMENVAGPDEVFCAYQKAYGEEPFAKVTRSDDPISAEELAGSDMFRINVSGNSDRVLVTCSLDNLGKGASGAAVQNMNIMLWLEETLGSRLER